MCVCWGRGRGVLSPVIPRWNGTFVEERLFIKFPVCNYYLSGTDRVGTEFPAPERARACTGAQVTWPMPPFPAFWKQVHSPWNRSRTWAVCWPLQWPFSMRLRPQLVGLLSVHPHPRLAELFTKYFVFRNLSLISLPLPSPPPHSYPSPNPMKVWPSTGSLTMKLVGPLHVLGKSLFSIKLP